MDAGQFVARTQSLPPDCRQRQRANLHAVEAEMLGRKICRAIEEARLLLAELGRGHGPMA